MRLLFIALVMAVTASSALLATSQPSSAGDNLLFASAAPDASKQEGRIATPNMSEPRLYANACGLCTDEDCCGGTENGWKLCKDGCPQGQYKCEQVAYCK